MHHHVFVRMTLLVSTALIAFSAAIPVYALNEQHFFSLYRSSEQRASWGAMIYGIDHYAW